MAKKERISNGVSKFYITTSIAYTTANPHVGFALELIQADVLARYNRFLGKDVFYLTGTDEHGFRVAEISKKLGKKPKEFTNEISSKFKELTKILNLSNDSFVRTTNQKYHEPAVKKVWLKLKENNDIYKKSYKALYCYRCETFVTKKDLVNNKCAIHKVEPGVVEEENYFFKLSKYLPIIKKKIEKDEIKIIPETRKNEVLGFIKTGIEDISFSRSKDKLKWGISVPDDSSQTIYVWADALTSYISAIGYAENSEKFKKYWPADVHCIGKDILKFHSLFWPAIILSIGLELPKIIFAHGFITVNGEKMSKSLGNVIDPFELVKKYGTDAVRYYLLREIPSTEDGDFTYEKFEQRYNADLASGVGNLVARVRTMAEKTGFKLGRIKEVEPKIREVQVKYKKALDKFKFNKALEAIWELVSFSDKYIEQKKPWEDKKDSPQVLNNLLIVLDNIVELLEPFLPETSEKIKKEINRKDKFINKKGKALFPRL